MTEYEKYSIEHPYSSEYSVSSAFKSIEDELVDSMMRNLEQHQAEETAEGISWESWQQAQLRALNEYSKRNRKLFMPKMADIISGATKAIKNARTEGGDNLMVQIQHAMARGWRRRVAINSTKGGEEGVFARTNDKKINALVKATKTDLTDASRATLRQADDMYRKVIFKSQLAYASGSKTYKQAIDAATKDFVKHGITSITYKNGSRHSISEYSGMAVKTAVKRAYLTGEADKRNEWGCNLVIVNKRTDACPDCAKWAGKILVDDVYGGGTRAESRRTGYPLLSEAMKEGFLHPNCRDSYTTYFPELADSYETDGYSRSEMSALEDADDSRTQKKIAGDNYAAYARLADYSLDPENKRKYIGLSNKWRNR